MTDQDVKDAVDNLAQVWKGALKTFGDTDALLWQEIFWMRYDWNQSTRIL
jgi:hypothetical protein